MVIGIDIDDVITDTSLSLINHTRLHETEVCEKGEILNHLPEIMRGGFPSPNVKTYFHRFMAEIMAATTVKEDAEDVLKRLKEAGHRLVYITARNDVTYPGSVQVTKRFLKKTALPCDEIIFYSIDKLEDCRKAKVDLMIDDSVKNCEDIAAGGIATLLFTSEVNKVQETDVPRVDHWLALEAYVAEFEKNSANA